MVFTNSDIERMLKSENVIKQEVKPDDNSTKYAISKTNNLAC